MESIVNLASLFQVYHDPQHVRTVLEICVPIPNGPIPLLSTLIQIQMIVNDIVVRNSIDAIDTTQHR